MQQITPRDGKHPKAYTQLDEFDKATILEMVDSGSTIEAVATKLDKHPSSIYRFLRGLRDTTKLAERYIKAKALTLAEKIVAGADVDQAIEILSRPNLNVLHAPVNKKDGPSILISVERDSCSAVVEGEVLPQLPKENDNARALPSHQEEPAIFREIRENSETDCGGDLQQDEEAGGSPDDGEARDEDDHSKQRSPVSPFEFLKEGPHGVAAPPFKERHGTRGNGKTSRR